ncbi:MAG: hypothetical protein H7Y28_15950 [Rhodoferax sp.]|nr:hypothetical protein [Rhodoferax sp.]
MRLKKVAIGLALAGFTLGSAALTLGRARGAAWIGQPLELAVSAQLESGQTANSLCAEADVFYADSRIEAGRIQISVEAAAQPDTAVIRIISPALVDEPVVTVYVRAGCTAKTTRRYVLLADFPSDNVSSPVRAVEPPPVPTVIPATATPEPRASSTPGAAPIAPAAETPKAASPRSVAPTVKADTAPPAAREPARPRKPVAESKEPKEVKAPSSNRARLKLDPIENLAERIKTLEATTSAQPLEDMVRDSQRIQELQSSVKALLDQAAKNEASLMAMRERMDRAESDRIPAWLVYALLAVVAACAAAIGVLWNRRDPSAWRSGLAAADAAVPARPQHAAEPEEPEAEDIGPSTQTLVQPVVRLKQQGRTIADPLDLGARPFESYVTVDTPQVASDSDIMAFGSDSNAYHPDFNSSKMFDLRLQAEFFAKLGKLDEAIEALEKRIRENSKDCPLIFLELLHVANQHSLKTDFRQFRDEMTAVFNVNVPEFALFRDEGRDLEGYPGVLSHIRQLWPMPQVMDVIEACVLITPGEKNAARFDLAAFRELVMLHGLVYQYTFQGKGADTSDHMDSEHVSLDL